MTNERKILFLNMTYITQYHNDNTIINTFVKILKQQSKNCFYNRFNIQTFVFFFLNNNSSQ